MARRSGRAVRGLRLLAAVPHGHWKVTTLIAGLRTAGITAPCVFDGAINGERFRNYVEQLLAPTLSHGDVVMLDNLSSHKAAGIETVIQARGAKLLCLPPYSPDRNPIKQPVAKPPCPRQVHGSGPGRHYTATGVSAGSLYNCRTFSRSSRDRVSSDRCPRSRVMTSQDLGHVEFGWG